jgi:hypothetical protein
LYCYSENNPVIGYDPNGNFACFSAIISTAFIGALIGVTSQFITDIIVNIEKNGLNTSQWIFSNIETYCGAALGGAAGGIASLLCGPVVSSSVDGFVSTATSMLLENLNGKSNFSAEEITLTSLFVGSFSGITASMFDGVSRNSKDAVDNFLQHSSRDFKIKIKLLKTGLINSFPTAVYNSYLNGFYLSPSYNH